MIGRLLWLLNHGLNTLQNLRSCLCGRDVKIKCTCSSVAERSFLKGCRRGFDSLQVLHIYGGVANSARGMACSWCEPATLAIHMSVGTGVGFVCSSHRHHIFGEVDQSGRSLRWDESRVYNLLLSTGEAGGSNPPLPSI